MKFPILSRRLAAFMLLLYGLTLACAMAVPVVIGKDMQLLCTSTGVKFVNIQNQQTNPVPVMQMHDCPLCLAGLEATWPSFEPVPPNHLLSYLLRSIPAARLATLIASALPARGPPAFLPFI